MRLLETGAVDMPPADPGYIGGPVVIPQCLEIRLRWTLANGRTAVNVIHGRYTGAPAWSVGAANAIATALSTLLTSSGLISQLHTTTSFAGVDIRDLGVANNAMFSSSNAAVPCTGTGTPLAPQTALVITLRTAKAGPGFRGRYYQCGWASVAQGAGGTAVAGATTALTAWGNGLGGAISPQGALLCIAQKARKAYTGDSGTVHPARNADTVLVTSQNVRNGIWDTQRKRAGRS